MYNKRELKKTEKSAVKSNPWAKDRVVTPGAPKVDLNGYWDPANIGRIIEVPSPSISMQGVEEPLVGVGSDTGMAQYMTEGNEYIFSDDSSVIEYPAEQYMELTEDEIAEYKAGGYVVEELPKAQKGITISDPDQFAYRQKMYNDSLSEYYDGKKYALMSEKDKGPYGTAPFNYKKTRHIPYDQMKNNLTLEKESFEYKDINISPSISKAESKKMQLQGKDPWNDKRSTNKDLFYKNNKIKPEGFDVYYDNTTGEIIYTPTFKKPVQPVNSNGKKYPATKVNFDPYSHDKIKVEPKIIGIPPEKNTDPTKMFVGTNEVIGYDENGKPVKSIEYVYDDVKLPTKKVERVTNEIAPNEIVREEHLKRYNSETGKWVDVIIPADSDYDQRTLEREAFRQKNLEYKKLQGLKKLPESSHDLSGYEFANGGYIADETYYPPKHNPANSFAVNDPRSMQIGGNYFSYAGRPDAKYMKKDDGWYINAPGTNDKYIKVEDPTGNRTELLNEQAVYHSGDKAKKAQTSVAGNAMRAAQDVFNPINDDILKVGDSVSGGGYNKAFAGSGTPFVISHNGQEILPAATSGTYCSGYTCGVTMKAMQQRGMLNEMTPEQLKDFQKTWYGAKGFEKGKSETLSVKALEDYNLGKGIKQDEAKAGDIAQIWRENGSGHSVIFKDWVTDKNGKKIGIKYRSSQPSTGGIGDRTEMFGTKINPERIYVARLNNHSKGGYVDAQMTHFQSGGNTDPGNNALELHMFYDKDVYKKRDGGHVGYYNDQEIEEMRRQGYIVEEE